MQKSMTYILAIHIPIAAMAMLPVLFKMPALLFPMHIAFLELVIDPACSLAFENEPQEENLMQRPPRDTKALLMGKNVMTMAIFQGIGAVIIIMLAYYLGLRQFTEPVARAFAFAVLVVSNLALIFSNRSRHRNFLKSFFLVNKTLWIVTVATIIFLSIVLYVPFLSAVFRFSPLPLHYFFGAILVGLSSTFWFEFIKLVTRDKKIEAGSGDQ
jgi:Ca2+-transporting ATPase